MQTGESFSAVVLNGDEVVIVARSSGHLLTLAHLGYLETDGSWFWLSSKVLRFSGSYLATSRLPRALQPTLERLAMQTGESFSAVVLNGDEVVIVARSSGQSGPTCPFVHTHPKPGWAHP